MAQAHFASSAIFIVNSKLDCGLVPRSTVGHLVVARLWDEHVAALGAGYGDRVWLWLSV